MLCRNTSCPEKGAGLGRKQRLNGYGAGSRFREAEAYRTGADHDGQLYQGRISTLRTLATSDDHATVERAGLSPKRLWLAHQTRKRPGIRFYNACGVTCRPGTGEGTRLCSDVHRSTATGPARADHMHLAETITESLHLNIGIPSCYQAVRGRPRTAGGVGLKRSISGGTHAP